MLDAVPVEQAVAAACAKATEPVIINSEARIIFFIRIPRNIG
jgi:hypothetical protein